MANYMIDDKKNLVEHQESTGGGGNMIKKSFNVTEFKFDGTPVPVSVDVTGWEIDKFIYGNLYYDSYNHSINSITLSNGMLQFEVSMNSLSTKDNKTGLGKVLSVIIFNGNIIAATIGVFDGTTTEPQFPIEDCVINFYFEE